MINFDGATKVISLSSGTTSLDVADLWSRYLDWLAIGDNSKFELAMESLGGDEIDAVSGTYVPAYVFLINGWKIKPQDADHTLKVSNGILLVAGGGDPFINTESSHVVRINYSQPVQAITVATGGGSGGGATSGDITSAKDEIILEIQKTLTTAKFFGLR